MEREQELSILSCGTWRVRWDCVGLGMVLAKADTTDWWAEVVLRAYICSSSFALPGLSSITSIALRAVVRLLYYGCVEIKVVQREK
jgi:hypothetical protein